MMLLTLEMSGFSRPREFTKPVGLKKIHSGDLFQKYAVSVCGFTGFMWTRACSFKSIRTGVDGALLRT